MIASAYFGIRPRPDAEAEEGMAALCRMFGADPATGRGAVVRL
jgi:hypothetical protein